MKYRSKDGLMSSTDPDNVALWNEIVDRMEAEKLSWTEALREMGVKLAHPDDGWVKRDAPEPKLTLSWYPQFNDDPQVGDLMALGWPSRHYRLVRVSRIERSRPGSPIPWTDYYYEDTGQRVPPEPKPPSLWQRLRRFLQDRAQ